MGVIDDDYAAEVEDLDSSFLEELKTTKDHEKSFEVYQKKLKKSREKFSGSYKKFNAAETKRLRNMKKKIAKNPKFKHLNVKHFDFEFNFWERLKMRWDVGFFNCKRKAYDTWNKVVPDWLIYGWCKTRDIVKYSWRDLVAAYEFKKEGLINWSAKKGALIWEEMKKGWVYAKGLSGKVLFWRKEKVEAKEEGEKAEGEEKKEEEKPKEGE